MEGKKRPMAIMGAMVEEISSLKEDMVIHSQEWVGGREYIVGELYGLQTVLVHSRWGKVASAATAATLIHRYGVGGIVFTGVAGAVAPHLEIGDIVVSQDLYQHDMDAQPFFEKYEIPLLAKKFFQADDKLIHWIQQSAQKFVSQGFEESVTQSVLNEFAISSPKIYCGRIASGDRFVSDHSFLDPKHETLAVEMEGASVAQVCFEQQIPFVIVRTISDKANLQAPLDFQRFVVKVASPYSKGIVKNLCDLLRADQE